MESINLGCLMAISAVLRLLLVAYGDWQDTHMEVRYTDVDYLVFSDAAAMVASGKSPFERSTYRYSPLLAFLLVPNSILHRSWGKLLFSGADLLVGLFIDTILKLRGVPDKVRLWSVAAWLFNPFTFTIGTRGNCEPIVCAIILWIVICLMNGERCLRQHSVLGKQNIYTPGKPALVQWGSGQNVPSKTATSRAGKPSICWTGLCCIFRSIVTRQTVTFGLFSGSMFFFWTALFFHLYGWDFLNEALLYHLTRTDPRHNFSIYFYHIYLHHQHGFSAIEKLISFLPQFMVQLALALQFAADLPFCLFVQTVAFVAFNKVMTAQYFVWFFCLLPLILPWSSMRLKTKGLICILVWMGSQIHWLMWAYLLEFKGKNVFVLLWLASLLFFAANTFVMLAIIQHHKYSPVFSDVAKDSKLE